MMSDTSDIGDISDISVQCLSVELSENEIE